MLMSFLVEAVDLRQAALGVVILLRVVVARYPPRRVVASQGKLRQLLLEPETDQRVVDAVVAHRELVAEAQTIVIQAETYLHHRRPLLGRMVHALHRAHGLLQRHQHLVVVVADIGLLAPHRVPHLVESAALHLLLHKGVCQVVAPLQFETHLRSCNHLLPVACQFVIRLAVDETESHLHPSVRAFQPQIVCTSHRHRQTCHQEKNKKESYFHHINYY